MLLAGVGLTGCTDDKTESDPGTWPSLEVKFLEAQYSTVKLEVTAANLTEIAYLATPKADAKETPTATIVFATGVKSAIADGVSSLTVSKLDPDTEYVIYVAATTANEEFFEKVLEVEAKTASFGDNAYDVFDVDYMSFSMNVKFQPTDPENVIKYLLIDMLTYNYQSMMYTDAEMMNLFDDIYHNYITENTVFVFNEENSILRDENGEPVTDEEGSMITLWNPMVPGQLNYVLLGEFASGEHPWGFGQGYYLPLWDQDAYYEAVGGGGGILGETGSRADDVEQGDFWTGYYQKIEVTNKKPEKLGEIKINTDKLRPNGGLLTFELCEGISYLVLGIFEEYDMEGIKASLLKDDLSNMQWALTSFNAPYIMNALVYEIPKGETDFSFNLTEYFIKFTPGTKYYVYAVGINDNTGSKQAFAKLEGFTLPEPTKPAPEVTVTGIDAPEGHEESPYEVWFNIKCTTGDAVTAKYAANYEREWEVELNAGRTNTDLIENGNAFTPDEIEKINSAEGYNVMFSTRPDANTYLGVIAYNDEGTGNDPDEDGSAIGKKRSMPVPDKEPVDSKYFESLLGEWTLSAEYEGGEAPMTCKVEIVSELTCPESLSQEVIDYYLSNTNYSKEQVEKLYEGFKKQLKLYNERLRGQNRLLCLGLDIDRPKYEYSTNYLAGWKTPYDLFIATTEEYNGYDTESMFFDFGPKWYLEMKSDGSVVAPFDVTNLPPLTLWNKGAEYYFIGISKMAITQGEFPVTISSDNSTITVGGYEYQGDTYYPNAAKIIYGGQYSTDTRVCGALTLTKGWNGESVKSVVKGGKSVTTNDVLGAERAVRPLSRTSVSDAKSYEPLKVTPLAEKSLRERWKQRAAGKYIRR